MYGPDKIYESAKRYLPVSKRPYARSPFRRLLREYFVHRAGFYYAHDSRFSARRTIIGERYVYTGNRTRLVKRTGRIPKKVGRSPNTALEVLVARLAIYWITQTKQAPTIHHRGHQKNELTQWEQFMTATLNGLGYFNVRKYLEKHSASV